MVLGELEEANEELKREKEIFKLNWR